MSDPVPPLSVTTGAPSARPVTRAFARKRAALVDISNKAGKSRVAKEGRPAAVESVVLAPNTRIEGADVPAGAPTATGRGPTVTGIDPAPDGDGYRELAPDIFEHFRRIEVSDLIAVLLLSAVVLIRPPSHRVTDDPPFHGIV